ncbi:beta-N-acetylglucosaminidase [Clostridium sporogenes]|uniref:glucosaminidase domain-containing protein n=3 Tax=Clostridium sporogenes TaxID=1509 RepID=UPI0013CFBF6A|nr:glucosaminidase domain-containing protein [Clostridium sporogenes]NFG00449.1 beta-N-acetylglucosaminidase [Clostridium sporogenes]NFQ93360.1 beta-N-acetylglucosaminidase [Clostridium sporogenes]
MIKKKYYLLPKIISLFFILFLFSIKVQAISNISINLKAPIHEGVIEDKELNIDGEIESISKIKLAYVYIDNNNVGQAKLNELEFKENTYKTKLEYNKDISSLKDGVYNLKILAIDEQDNKEEKEISIKIKRNQEEVSDNRVNIYEEQLVENDKNIVQRNLEYDNVKISSTEKALTTVYNKATISNLEVSLNGTVVTNGKLEQGKTYTIKGNGNSANGVLYQFWIKDPYTQVWQMIRDYGTGNSMNWTPTRTGKYLVGIHVKDKNSKERLDDHKYVEYNVEQNSSKATISNLEVSLNGTIVTNGKLEQGKTYTIKGNGNSSNGVLYQFWIKDPYTQVWQMIRDYGTGNSMNWTPTRTGKYLVGIHVKDKNSKERLDDHKYVEYNVEQSSSKATISNLEVSLNGTVVANGKLEQGKTYTIKGNGNSANGVLYQFWIKDPYTQVWQMIRDYGTGNSMNWTPIGAGKYLVGIHVKDKNSKERLDDHKYVEYNAIGSNKNYKNSYYNITLDEMINRQMANTPAYHMYIADKNIYEWRYAIIKNGKKGYSTDINGVNWIQSDQQYDYIKSRAREYIDPTNQIYDSIGQYQFLQLSYNECTTAEQLNNILKGKGVLEGKGQAFIDAGKESNVSPIYLIAHSLLETGNGTSTLAKGVVVNGKTVYNLFGINAVDSDPIGQGSKYAYEQGWFSVDLAIKGGAKWISSRYINNPIYKQDTLYKMRWNPDNPTVHQYATDIRWAYNQVSNIKKVIDQLQNVVLNFDVPVFK